MSRPANGCPQKTDVIERFVSVAAGLRTKNCPPRWLQRAKAQRESSMSPARPPGDFFSKSSQKAGFSRPQLPGGERGGTSIGSGPEPPPPPPVPPPPLPPVALGVCGDL